MKRGANEFKRFDIVKIRENLTSSMDNTTHEMEELAGSIQIISNVRSDSYNLYHEEWAWEDFMLTEPTKQEIIDEIINNDLFANNYKEVMELKRKEL